MMGRETGHRKRGVPGKVSVLSCLFSLRRLTARRLDRSRGALLGGITSSWDIRRRTTRVKRRRRERNRGVLVLFEFEQVGKLTLVAEPLSVN